MGEGKRLAQPLLEVNANSYLGYKIIFPYFSKNKIEETTLLRSEDLNTILVKLLMS